MPATRTVWHGWWLLFGLVSTVTATARTISTYADLVAMPAVQSGDRITFAPGPFDCSAGCTQATARVAELLILSVTDVRVDATGAVFDCGCPTGGLNEISLGSGYPDWKAFISVLDSTEIVISNFEFASAASAILVRFSEVTVSNLFIHNTIDYGSTSRLQGIRVRDYVDETSTFMSGLDPGVYSPSQVTLNNVWMNHTRGLLAGGGLQVHGIGAVNDVQTSVMWTTGGIYDATAYNTAAGKSAVGNIGASFILAFNASLDFTDLSFDQGSLDIGQGGACICGGVTLFNINAIFTRTAIRNAVACGGAPNSFGGGILVGMYTTLELRDSIIEANTIDQGGAIYVTGDDICPNYATMWGFQDGQEQNRLCDSLITGDADTAPTVRISGTRIADNFARSRTGGIYIKSPATVIFDGTTPSSFVRNSQASAAGASAIYCTDSSPKSILHAEVNASISYQGNQLGGSSSAVDCTSCGCCTLGVFRGTLPENGPIDGSRTLATCAHGFQPSDPAGVLCNAGTQAPAVTSVCLAIPCPALTNPPNGRVSPLTGSHASVSTYTCRPGYTISGPTTITCDAGTWTGNATCVGLPCPALDNPDSGSLSYATPSGASTNAPVVGDSALVMCQTGYTLSGSTGWDCAANSTGQSVWVPKSSTASTCSPIQCATGAGAEYTATCDATAVYQQTCTFTCQAGYGGVTVVDNACGQTTVNAQGSFAALPTCAPCVRDSYSNAGDPSCTPCTNGYTASAASAGAQSCLCLSGFHDPTDSGNCVTCPTGATCNGGKASPIASAGYIQSAGAFILCVPKASCNGDNLCAPGYEGRLCGTCAPGFYRVGGRCTTCDRSAPANLAVAIVILLILGLLLAWAAAPNAWGGKESVVAPVFTMLFFAQIVSVFQDVRFEWAENVLDMFAVLSSVNFNIDLLNLDCLFPAFNFYSRLFFYLALPLIMLCVYALLLTGLVLFSMSRRRVTFGEALNANLVFVAGGFLLFCQTFYLAVTRYTFAFFACFQQGDGTYILSLAPDLECYTPQWYQALAFPVFGLVFYVAGIPFVSWWMLRHYTRTGSVAIAVSHPLTHHYVARYTVAHRAWELTVLLRKFAIAIFLAIFAEQPVLQAVLCGAVLFLACVASTVYRPLAVTRNNHAESISLVGTFAVLFAGLIAVPEGVSANSRTIVGVIIIVIVAAELLFLAYAVARDILAAMKHYRTLQQSFSITRTTSTGHPSSAVLNISDVDSAVVGTESIAILKNGEIETTVDAPGAISQSCALSSFAVAVAVDNGVHVINTATGKTLASADIDGTCTALAASEESLVAAVADGSALTLWRHDNSSSKMSLSDAQTVALPDTLTATALHVAGFYAWVGTSAGSILRADIVTGKAPSAAWTTHPGGASITCMTSRDNVLLVGGTDGVIALFDTTAARVVNTLIGHYGPIASLSLLPGMDLLTGAHDGTIRLWKQSPKHAHLLATLSIPHSPYVAAHATAAPSGKVAAAWSAEESETEVSALAAGVAVATVAGSKGVAYSLVVQPAAFALREKADKQACCARKQDISHTSAISGRLNNDDAEAAFWDLDSKHLATSLQGYISAPLLQRLSTDEQRRLHRAAHVSSRERHHLLQLHQTSSTGGSGGINRSSGSGGINRSSGTGSGPRGDHSSSDGSAAGGSSKVQLTSSKSKSAASGSSIAPLSE